MVCFMRRCTCGNWARFAYEYKRMLLLQRTWRMCRVPDAWNCPWRSWGRPGVMLRNRTSRFQTSLPRKMESAIGRWKIPNKRMRILLNFIFHKVFLNLFSINWPRLFCPGFKVWRLLENVIHICQWNNLFLFWFEDNRPLYSKDFWKIPPIIKITSFSLKIRMGSCQSRTLDSVCELYYFVFSRYLRSISYREFTRLVHGYLGKRRIPLPACAYTAIRKAFPTKEDEPLTGFQLDED